ncbi:HRDC domain-containing protein [Oceanithermus sp.]|uniref:HRDC domain-containing protein n=1 Tax=Oceanithermus sp. TaxID=2268145 RepID=UPI0025DC5B83|nr:HRDC domain-containing protein [Oceanithermus sp.]
MKPSTRHMLGLTLAALGLLYLIGTAPVLPAWAWGLVGAAVMFALRRYGAPEEALGLGAALAGWALGALGADLTGLQSLKLVGTGLGIGLWGWQDGHDLAAWTGGALLVAGALVFLWESAVGTWAALGLLALGAWLVLRRGEETSAPTDAGDEEVFAQLVRWRNRRAAEAGTRNVEVLSDAELGCIAALENPTEPEAVARCLERGGAKRAAEIAEALRGASRG